MEAEALGQRHMEVKEEDSGFIYGTRKEDLEGGGLSY
jgi:hypothetical protein